jgi:hypothetical protein
VSDQRQSVPNKNRLTKIVVNVVDQSDQRYDTLGDWQVIPDDVAKTTTISILVSKQKDERSTFAVAIHELVEAVACYFNGVTQQAVDDYDLEQLGAFGVADSHAPYFHEHNAAITCEAAFCASVALSFEAHELALEQAIIEYQKEKRHKTLRG